MKKLVSKISLAVFIALVTFLITTFVLPCAAAQAASTPQCWGVFAGVSDYRTINDLRYCDDDARELYGAFSPVWGTSNTRLLVDSQASKSGLLSAISWMAANADADDTVVFTFSGHGSSAGVFCPWDYSSTSTGISTSELANALNAVQAGKIIVVLDVCYAGQFQASLSRNGRILMFACRSYELSYETSVFQNGVFGYYILRAISNFDTVDTNHDYELSAEEIATYANPLTTGYISAQHPVLDDQFIGSLALLVKFLFTTNTNLPAGATILTVDGVNYTTIPGAKLWIPGSTHTVSVPQIIDKGTGTRYVFTQWSDGTTSVTKIVSKGSYTANYDIEQLLSIISAFGNPTGAGWYKNGATSSFSVTSYIETTDTRHYFTGWSGDFTGTSASGSLLMIAPKTVTANWRHEYLLSLTSAYGNPQGAGWYREGETASFSVTSYIETTDTKHYFTGWSGAYSGTSSSSSILMGAPKVINANWRHEYLLTLNSEYGAPTGAGWYREGQVAGVSVEPVQGFIIRHIFNGWSGDLTGTSETSSVNMNAPKVVTATWRTDYIQLYILIGGVVVLGGIIATVVIVVRRNKKVV